MSTRCPIHDESLVCEHGEWICSECSLEYARQAYYAAVDEMYATLADGLEKVDWRQTESDHPF